MILEIDITEEMINSFKFGAETQNFEKFNKDYGEITSKLDNLRFLQFENNPLCSYIVPNIKNILKIVEKFSGNYPDVFVRGAYELENCFPDLWKDIKLAILKKDWSGFYEKYRSSADLIITEARKQNIIKFSIPFGAGYYDTFEMRDMARDHLSPNDSVRPAVNRGDFFLSKNSGEMLLNPPVLQINESNNPIVNPRTSPLKKSNVESVSNRTGAPLSFVNKSSGTKWTAKPKTSNVSGRIDRIIPEEPTQMYRIPDRSDSTKVVVEDAQVSQESVSSAYIGFINSIQADVEKRNISKDSINGKLNIRFRPISVDTSQSDLYRNSAASTTRVENAQIIMGRQSAEIGLSRLTGEFAGNDPSEYVTMQSSISDDEWQTLKPTTNDSTYSDEPSEPVTKEIEVVHYGNDFLSDIEQDNQTSNRTSYTFSTDDFEMIETHKKDETKSYEEEGKVNMESCTNASTQSLDDSFKEIDDQFQEELRAQEERNRKKEEEMREERERRQEEYRKEFEELKKESRERIQALMDCIRMKVRIDEQVDLWKDWIRKCQESVNIVSLGFSKFQNDYDQCFYSRKRQAELESENFKCDTMDFLKIVTRAYNSLQNDFENLKALGEKCSQTGFIKILQKCVCDTANHIVNVAKLTENILNGNNAYEHLKEAMKCIRHDAIFSTEKLQQICRYEEEFYINQNYEFPNLFSSSEIFEI